MTHIELADEMWKDVEAQAPALADQWLVGEGDRVNAGQVVARVVLVKTTLDGAAPVSGIIERIAVRTGQAFARGKPLAVMRDG